MNSPPVDVPKYQKIHELQPIFLTEFNGHGFLIGIILGTILDYKRDPYSTVKGPLIRPILTVAHLWLAAFFLGNCWAAFPFTLSDVIILNNVCTITCMSHSVMKAGIIYYF